MTLSRRVLRWLDPQQEKRRQEFRMFIAENMAHAEDLTRTVLKMNGSLNQRVEEMSKVKDKM